MPLLAFDNNARQIPLIRYISASIQPLYRDKNMAKISDKNIRDLSTWDMKELRKLKINANNRMNALRNNPKKQISEKQLLYGLESSGLKNLLLEITRAEKKLCS